MLNNDLRGEEILVIGDTPRDIECARAFGASAVAVATGRLGVAELRAHVPDHLFADLGDTERVLAAILDGHGER